MSTNTVQQSKILSIKQIRHLLQDRRLEVVASACGLHYNTVLYIRDTDQRNIGYKTLEKLSVYFERDNVDGII